MYLTNDDDESSSVKIKDEKKLYTHIKTKLSEILKTKKFVVGNKQSYPLRLTLKKNYYKNNVIILGDGLHVVHPLAGQGFNLILRDIKRLDELISKNLKLGLPIKNSNIPRDLSEVRKPENLLIGINNIIIYEEYKYRCYWSWIRRSTFSH